MFKREVICPCFLGVFIVLAQNRSCLISGHHSDRACSTIACLLHAACLHFEFGLAYLRAPGESKTSRKHAFQIARQRYSVDYGCYLKCVLARSFAFAQCSHEQSRVSAVQSASMQQANSSPGMRPTAPWFQERLQQLAE